jgi:hypothetical protein
MTWLLLNASVSSQAATLLYHIKGELMSESLTVSSSTLQLGGIGMGAGMFRARPSMVEMVHTTTRQEGAVPGQFRVINSNEHLGSSIRVVLLAVPQVQREYFKDPSVFTKENKACFSLDGVQPHARASEPPALYCSTCPMGDMRWEKWRRTKDPKDLPSCNAYYHLLIADRSTQAVYYLNVKGKSYAPFRQAMEQQMSSLLAKLLANAKSENKKLGYTYVTSEGKFIPIPGFVLPEGQAQKPPLPLPNIFNISFNITAERKAGSPYVMRFHDFKLMSPEDISEFGNLYMEIAQQRQDSSQAINEEAEINEAVSEPPATTEVTQGEVLTPQRPQITI